MDLHRGGFKFKNAFSPSSPFFSLPLIKTRMQPLRRKGGKSGEEGLATRNCLAVARRRRRVLPPSTQNCPREKLQGMHLIFFELRHRRHTPPFRKRVKLKQNTFTAVFFNLRGAGTHFPTFFTMTKSGFEKKIRCVVQPFFPPRMGNNSFPPFPEPPHVISPKKKSDPQMSRKTFPFLALQSLLSPPLLSSPLLPFPNCGPPGHSFLFSLLA